MKKFIFIVSIFMAANAQASFFQNNCSSADGYVTKADGSEFF